MGITTHSANRPQPIQKATTTKTTTPKGGKRRSERISKSPTSVDVNSILADINRPQTRFNNVLTALGHATETNVETEDTHTPTEDDSPANEEEEEDNLLPSQGPPPTSPVPDPTGSPTIRISENKEVNPPTSNPATTTSTRSILRSTSPAETTRRTTTDAADYQTNDDP